MHKRLLKKLLDTQSDKMSTSNLSDDNTQNQKYAQYYSTDKSRNVITRIPSNMSITYEPTSSISNTNTYSDNLSDVSSKLLKQIINNNNNSKPLNSKPLNSKPLNSKPLNSKPLNSKPLNSKPLRYYSTDKEKYTTQFVPSKLDLINNLSDLSTDAIIDSYNDENLSDAIIDSYNDDSETNLSDAIIDSYNDDSETHSDTNLYNNTNLYNKNSYRYSDSTNLSEPSSIYSQDLSNKSSYNSDSNTSYDSFYDNSVKEKAYDSFYDNSVKEKAYDSFYDNSVKEKAYDSFYDNSVKEKDDYFNNLIKKYSLEDLEDFEL